jgi:hypothetical protein
MKWIQDAVVGNGQERKPTELVRVPQRNLALCELFIPIPGRRDDLGIEIDRPEPHIGIDAAVEDPELPEETAEDEKSGRHGG